MAYVGTPLDTTNAFQSLAGKRFSGDASTTDFTLDSSPNSTLDIEVFVENVRQDPNSAYTVSGTTLAFTAAPPSGTNNIYVVHQAKAVGTIDPAVGSTLDLNGAAELILDADADTAISADAADDQIDIKIGGVDEVTLTSSGIVINEGSNDRDFRIESNGNTHMLFVDGGNDKVGIGESAAAPLGTLHVYAGNSTATSVQSNSTALVVEGAANAGIQLLSTNDEYNTINFGDPEDPNIGNIQYYHTNNSMHFVTSTTEVLRLNAGSSAEINPSAAAHGGTGFFIYGASGQTVAQLKHADTSGSDTLILFKDGANTNCGSITIDTSNNTVAYATSSDYRLKENETAITDGITRLKQLKPYRFNWKSNSGGNKEDGFFAHEVQSIVPEAISGTKDETETVKNVVLDSSGNIIKEEITEDAWKKDKEDGIYASDTTWSAEKKNIIKPQSMDYGKITPLLAAALKEAITKIETLETKVKTLEDA